MRLWPAVFLILCLAVHCAAGTKSCSQNRSLRHDLSIGGSIGFSGSDFTKDEAPVTITINNSDCPGIENGLQTASVTVKRVSTDLTISESNASSLELQLAGDDITTDSLEISNSACTVTMSGISGSLDYTDSELKWSYKIQYEQKDECPALVKRRTLIN